VKNLYVYAGGFEQFQQTYPNLCSANDDDDNDRYSPPCLEVGRLSLSSNDRDDAAEQPTEERPSLRDLIISSPPTLIAPFLYIGNAQNALDMDCLKTNGIRYIVNVTNNIPNRSATDPPASGPPLLQIFDRLAVFFCIGEKFSEM